MNETKIFRRKKKQTKTLDKMEFVFFCQKINAKLMYSNEITTDKHLYMYYVYKKSIAIDFSALLECNT